MSRHPRLLENFRAGDFVFKFGASDAKSYPEPRGRIQPPGSEWRRSKFGRVVLLSVRKGATECDESRISSHLLQRCRMVESSSTSSSSPTVKTAALLNGTKVPKPTLFFLCLSLRHTFSFSTHSLRVLSQPPPFFCRGVVFRSPLATRGRPR